MIYGGNSRNVTIQFDNQMQNNHDYADTVTLSDDSSDVKVQVLNVLKQRDSKWIVLLISYNSLVIYYLWEWSISAGSIGATRNLLYAKALTAKLWSAALRAYVNTLVFGVCALAVCLISIWVEQNTLRESRRFAYSGGPDHRGAKSVSELPGCKSPTKRHAAECRGSTARTACLPSRHFPREENCTDQTSIRVLGLEKYEVLALLLSSCFSLSQGLLVTVDAAARIQDQPIVHEGQLGLGALLGFSAHLLTIVLYPDAKLNHVVCKAIPCPTLKGANPILSANFIGFAILCGVYTALHFGDLHAFDTAAAFAIIGLTVASLLPLAFYTASITFQKLSYHMSEQLDQCLREALIIDGVLEFRNERFWTKSFGKLAGSLEVRIRRNADERHVLRRVVKRLSRVVSTLKVREFREAASRPDGRFAGALPLEYYVEELLGLRGEKGERRPPVNSAARIEEETLNWTGRPAEKMRRGYATLLRNDRDCAPADRNYLFRGVAAGNALLMGGRYDLDELHCSVIIECPV